MIWGNTLQRRHNERDHISIHRHHNSLLSRLFICRENKTPDPRVIGLHAGNSPWPVNSPHKGPVTRKKFSISWRHHDLGVAGSIEVMVKILCIIEVRTEYHVACLQWFTQCPGPISLMFKSYPKFEKNSFWLHAKYSYKSLPIPRQHSIAVVECAEFCNDIMPKNELY